LLTKSSAPNIFGSRGSPWARASTRKPPIKSDMKGHRRASAATANAAAAVAHAVSSASSRGSTSAGPVADAVSKHVGPRQLSKRREQSAVHLHNVMNQVQDQLTVVPQQSLGIAAMGLSTRASSPAPPEPPEAITREGVSSPASLRKNVSLRFPRVSASSHGEPTPHAKDSSESGPATASTAAAHSIGAAQLAVIPSSSLHSGAGSASEQLEDLRLQNAVLRKSLAMLQQSVVESMKGNRAQFMGNGIFHQQKTATAGGQRQSVGGSTSSSAAIGAAANAAQEADLEGLRAALADRRASLRDALKERDDAIRDAEAARREAAELALKNEVLAAELKDCQARLEDANAARVRVEAELDAAAARALQLEADAEALRRQVDAAQRALVEAEERARSLRSELEATLSAQTTAAAAAEVERAALQADILRLQEAIGSNQGRLVLLSEQRRALARRTLATIFDDSRSWLRICFGSWFAYLAAEREARLDERATRLEADVAQHVSEARTARSEREALQASIEAQRQEASEASRRFGEVEERYASAANEASQWKIRAEKAEARAQALDQEIRTSKQNSEAGNSKTALELKAAEERLRQCEKRMRELEAELAALHGASGEASRAASALSQEAEARETSLRKELQAAKDAAKRAREAEALATRQRDEARQRSLEHEHQKKNIVAELEASKARAGQMAKEAQGARGRAEEAEKRVRELQSQAQELQRRAQELEAREAQESQRSKDADKSQAEELKKASKEVDGLVKRNSQLTSETAELRICLAEAKCDAKSAAEKLRALSEEHAVLARAFDEAKATQQEVQRRGEELRGMSSRFATDARKALDEARQNIRIMVTAPKVAVNVGGTTVDMNTPFPFCAIKETVQKEVMPKFARVFAVGEEAGDAEIRQDVQDMVEKLALTLQTKVHELLPQAEGTTNWDGFGAKCGGLGKR